MENFNDLKAKIEKILAKQITEFSLKGQGDCNYAYYVETIDGDKYIAKVEKEKKETEDQNDLIVEAAILRQLYEAKPSVPVPNVVAVSESPKFYVYEYIDGDLMRGVWDSLSEEERIDICRSLGQFHAEIGQRLSKETCRASGVDINESVGLRPKIIEEEYNRLILEPDIPEAFKDFAKEAKRIFDGTTDNLIFQFIHNDGHPENILIKDKKIVGIIDFGDAEYGDVAKEFSRYVRDLPDYFAYIVSSYEETSGNKLSLERIVSNALISGFPEIVEDYLKGEEDRARVEKTIETYKRMISDILKSSQV